MPTGALLGTMHHIVDKPANRHDIRWAFVLIGRRPANAVTVERQAADCIGVSATTSAQVRCAACWRDGGR